VKEGEECDGELWCKIPQSFVSICINKMYIVLCIKNKIIVCSLFSSNK